MLERARPVELDRRVDRLLRGLGRQQLGHRRQRGIAARRRRRPSPPGGPAGGPPRTRAVSSASRCATAWWLGQRLAEGLALERLVGGELECVRAMPTANAPTLGPEQVERPHRHPEARRRARRARGRGDTSTSSKRSEPIACGASSRLALAAQALACRPATGERGQPARALRGAREHGVDVGLGRVGDPQLLAVAGGSRLAVGRRPAATSPPRPSRPRARSARTRPPRVPSATRGIHRSRSSGEPAWRIG